MDEIPGAYNQAFELDGHMEVEDGSDDEVTGLREGMVAVTLSKDVKWRIRDPWINSLVVKVYGRVVGYHFLQAKLLALWKPTGKLDFIDLGRDFYLIRFGLKEDYSAVLEKGPWFVGENFLSIRPWEPNFKPFSANVTSIVVWVRFLELPIEYYDMEILKQIGKSVGHVLRIDTHTATETKERYARLCIQVDINKPLITSVVLGGREQPICYEGIHRLYFACGRIGHWREACPYVDKQDRTSSLNGVMEGSDLTRREVEARLGQKREEISKDKGQNNNGMAQRKNSVNSIKGKMDFTRNRAITSSGNVARELQTQPLQFEQKVLEPLSLQESPLSSLGHTNVETKFHFSATLRNTVGQKSQGGGVVQCKVEENLGDHLPTDEIECKGGEITTHTMRDKAIGMLDREKNVGDNADFHQHHE
ncbi:hypothetical protein SO802_014532 [Lithocarpus litseifolius]|uniref:DUF4283 domain-containing protein n=1 Tax=Lithocarpus litseifolius TaxID=425828 RepID=A0AAW2CUR7_9ROSI